MKKNIANKNFITGLIIIGVLSFAGWICNTITIGPECMKEGCNRGRTPGSKYCYDHKLRENKLSTDSEPTSEDQSSTDSSTDRGSSQKTYSNINNNDSNDSDSSYSNHTRKNTYGTAGSPKAGTYDSYDEGYDDIYMDGDYDDDRYNSDGRYADGVDDAMDDDEEDW